MQQRKVQGVLLDIDGTLVDSNEAHAIAWVRAMEENGIHKTLDEVCPLIGMGSDHILPTLLGISPQSELGRKIKAGKDAIFKKDFLPELKPTCGATALVKTLYQLGLKLGVATSAGEDDLHALLKIFHGEPLLRIHSSKSEAGASKPSPNTVEVALEKLGTYPGETFMIGDSPYDIEASLQVGIQTIALRCGGFSDEELNGAIAIFDHPQDLLENLEFSPLAPALISASSRISANQKKSA